jgi:hypothetical protein
MVSSQIFEQTAFLIVETGGQCHRDGDALMTSGYWIAQLWDALVFKR